MWQHVIESNFHNLEDNIWCRFQKIQWYLLKFKNHIFPYPFVQLHSIFNDSNETSTQKICLFELRQVTTIKLTKDNKEQM